LHTYGVEVDEVTLVLGATEKRAVMASELLPGSMEVIGHNIDEVQIPRGAHRKVSNFSPNVLMAITQNCKGLMQEVQLYLAISAISYPASMVPFPADTAAVSMSCLFPVAAASAAYAATSSWTLNK